MSCRCHRVSQRTLGRTLARRYTGEWLLDDQIKWLFAPIFLLGRVNQQRDKRRENWNTHQSQKNLLGNPAVQWGLFFVLTAIWDLTSHVGLARKWCLWLGATSVTAESWLNNIVHLQGVHPVKERTRDQTTLNTSCNCVWSYLQSRQWGRVEEEGSAIWAQYLPVLGTAPSNFQIGSFTITCCSLPLDAMWHVYI